MTLYTLKPWRNDGQYYLVKWPEALEGHKEPLELYYMNGVYCGCPSPRKPCKHEAIKDAILAESRRLDVPCWTLYWEDGTIGVLLDTPPSLPGL